MPANVAARPTGQVTGAVSSARVAAISSSSSNGSRDFAVHLVDEGDDRDVAQAANLEQLAGARLDALGGVDHHDGGIDGGQRAVGVLREVLVAGRVEQVEDAAGMFERHDGGDDGDAALALDAHPVGAGAPALALGANAAGKLDGAAGAQQMLGQRRFAGVGVGDDREGAAAGDLGGGVWVGVVGHGASCKSAGIGDPGAVGCHIGRESRKPGATGR